MKMKRQYNLRVLYIFFLSLFMFQFNAFSQIISDHLKIYINEADQSISTKIFSSRNKKIEPDKERTYFWYSNNQVLQTKGGYDGKLLDGEYSVFYLNNNLKEKGNFKKGLKQGEWRSWYENGKLKERCEWKKGFQNGIHEVYNENGEKTISSHFKNNKLHGEQVYFGSGKIISIKRFKNGLELVPKPKIEKECKEKKDEPNGKKKDKDAVSSSRNRDQGNEQKRLKKNSTDKKNDHTEKPVKKEKRAKEKRGTTTPKPEEKEK